MIMFHVNLPGCSILIASWWFQPTHLKKYARQMRSFPPGKGENKKYFENQHLDCCGRSSTS